MRDERRPSADDEALDDEIRFHLEMRARELVEGGLDPRDAEAEARLRFGDVDSIRSQCHRIRVEEDRHVRRFTFFDDLRQDLVCGIRGLGKNRAFASVAVLTLALGIGAATAMFSVLHAVVLRPLAFEEPERIAVVGENWYGLGPTNVSVGNFVDWRRASADVFDWLVAMDYGSFNLSEGGEPERVLGARVSHGFFDLLRMPPLRGRWFRAEEDRPDGDRVVILSHALWSRRFGSDPQILGREIRLNGTPHTVVGVMPAAFSYPARDQELWIPAAFTPEQEAMHDEHYLDVFGRLRPGVSYEAARARMDAVGAEQMKLYPQDSSGIALASYAEWLVGDYRKRFLVMMGAVGLVLLIACANVSNLLLARGAARAREMAVRAALGAGTGRLARQVLAETSLLALLAAALGTALSYVLTATLIASAPRGVPRLEETTVDPSVLGFALLIAILASLVSGLIPATAAARAEIPALRGEHRAGGSRTQGRIRFALVSAEIALALTLLAGAGLLLRSAFEMGRVRPGFEPKGVLTARVTLPRDDYLEPERVVATFDRIVSAAAAIPGVRRAAVTSQVPMGPGGGTNGLVPEGKSFEEHISSRLRMVTPEYFAAMGIPLLEGRLFQASDRRDSVLVMVVSETLARAAFPGESALGKRIACCEGGPDDPKLKTVVGVVGDVRSRGLGAEVEPEFYLPIAQAPPVAWNWIERTMTVALKAQTEAPESLVPSLRAAVRGIDPVLPLHGIATMQQRVLDSTAQPRFLASLLLVMSLLGLALAAVGVYGVMGYLAALRAHEIGVRMALGARAGDVVLLVVRQAMIPVALGIGLGLVAAMGGAGLLSSQLFGIRPNDPWTFFGVAALLALVALFASYLPARRTARVDPKRALYQA
jgi:predicted permease